MSVLIHEQGGRQKIYYPDEVALKKAGLCCLNFGSASVRAGLGLRPSVRILETGAA